MSNEPRIIELTDPHFENPSLTHCEVMSIHPHDILIRWHDGTEAKGSRVAIPHGREPDEETGEVDMELSDLEIAALVGAYLTAEANKPEPEQSLKSRMYDEWMNLPATIRGPFFPYWSAINAALDLGDIEGSKEAIKSAPVPPELEPIRAKLLGMMPE